MTSTSEPTSVEGDARPAGAAASSPTQPGPARPSSGDAHGRRGWQANLDVVERWKRQRPGLIYEEERVPSYELPDPLRTSDGSVVDSPQAWRRRREEILRLFRTHVYGHRPPEHDHRTQRRFDVVEEDPSAMDGAATLRRVVVRSEAAHSEHPRRPHQFEVILFLPNAASDPVPVFLLLNNGGPENTDPSREHKSPFWPAEEVVARGYGIAALQVGDLAPDDATRFREGIIGHVEGDLEQRPPDAWKALAAWGWGASRAMDYFETDPRIDHTKVAVLGHSRGGKAALWAGAEDERFALVISNESGCGGAALSRRRVGETIAAINRRFPHWFCDNFQRYNDAEDALPVDQHMLIALMAPRAVYVASADEDLWADPRGEFLSLAHASPVYRLWGYPALSPDDMPPLDTPLRVGPRGYHIRTGDHNLTEVDWNNYMDFADTLWR